MVISLIHEQLPSFSSKMLYNGIFPKNPLAIVNVRGILGISTGLLKSLNGSILIFFLPQIIISSQNQGNNLSFQNDSKKNMLINLHDYIQLPDIIKIK